MKHFLLVISTILLVACSSESNWVSTSVGDTNLSLQVPDSMQTEYKAKTLDVGIEQHNFMAFNPEGTQIIRLELTRYPEEVDFDKIPIHLDCNVLKQYVGESSLIGSQTVTILGAQAKMLSCDTEKLNVHLLSFPTNGQHLTIVVANDLQTKPIDIDKLVSGFQYL